MLPLITIARRALALVLTLSMLAAPALVLPAPAPARSTRAGAGAGIPTHALMTTHDHMTALATTISDLRGVNVTGSEYGCIQGWGYSERPIDAALIADARELGATAIRVPLNEDCWLGINSTSAYTGAGYRAWLDNAVTTITDAGLSVILDLHWTAPLSETATRQAHMPDGHSLTFWTGVAARYKDSARVLYDAFNEPVGISNGDSEQNWACWRDGGAACPGLTDAVGMQPIVSAIRATGATQPIILGGLGYAQIMTRYLTYLPTDPLHNLVAGIHITGGWCPDVACWDRQYAPIAAVMPMITGEIYSDGVLPVNPAGRVYTELAWLDAHGIGQIAWVDNTWGSAETLRNGNGSLSSWGWLWRAHTRASLGLAGHTIVDGSFENGWAGANSLYFGAPSIVPYAAHTGGHAEQLSAANDGVGQALGNLTPHQPITASVWVTNKVAGQAVCLAFAGAPQAPACSTATTYTQLTTTYTPTTTSAIVLVYKQSGFDASWVDDLSVIRDAAGPVFSATPTPADTATDTPTDTPTDTRTTQTPAPSAPTGLHVSGAQLLDGAGAVVVLHGVNHSGTDYQCANAGYGYWDGFNGDTNLAAISTMARFGGYTGYRNGYGVSAVRVEMNEACWLGLSGVPANQSGAAYQSAMVQYVQNLNAAGMVVILGLHNAAPDGKGATDVPMPDDNTLTFWSQVATTFKSYSSVLFNLYNEPHPLNNTVSDAAWACWRDGDPAGRTACGTGGPTPYHAQGFQAVVTAIRNTGATQPLIIGGIAYSGYVDKWEQYKPTDPLNQLIADTHSYGNGTILTTSQYQTAYGGFLTAAQNPLIFNEIGDNDCEAGGVSNSHINSLMPWLDQRGIGYLAWTYNTWNCSSGPALITSYGGATTAYGAVYQQHLVALNQAAAMATAVPTATATTVLTATATAVPTATASSFPTVTATATAVPLSTSTAQAPATQTPPALPATQTTTAATNTPTPTAPVPTATATATASVHVTLTPNPWPAIDALQTRVAWLEKRVATVDARDKAGATVVARVRGDLGAWPAP